MMNGLQAPPLLTGNRASATSRLRGSHGNSFQRPRRTSGSCHSAFWLALVNMAAMAPAAGRQAIRAVFESLCAFVVSVRKIIPSRNAAILDLQGDFRR